MRFGSSLAFVYDESWAFFRRAWWLALIPSIPVIAGFFVLTDNSSPKAWEQATFWGVVGLAAALQAMLPYFVMRFVALRHDLAAALAINRASARTYAPYLAAMAALNTISMVASWLGQPFATAAGVAWLVLFPLLSLWSVTAPSGSTVIGPLRSARVVLPHFVWAVAFLFCALTPLSLLQFAADAALGRLLGSLNEDASRSTVLAMTDALFSVAIDLLFFVSQFVIAQKAGLRVSEDRTLATVFD